jgi:hypothetical protein
MVDGSIKAIISFLTVNSVVSLTAHKAGVEVVALCSPREMSKTTNHDRQA